MPNILRPIGICDLCGGKISPDRWYAWEAAPRLQCSTLCHNTANSRGTAKERGEELSCRYTGSQRTYQRRRAANRKPA